MCLNYKLHEAPFSCFIQSFMPNLEQGPVHSDCSINIRGVKKELTINVLVGIVPNKYFWMDKWTSSVVMAWFCYITPTRCFTGASGTRYRISNRIMALLAPNLGSWATLDIPCESFLKLRRAKMMPASDTTVMRGTVDILGGLKHAYCLWTCQVHKFNP